MDYTKFDQIIDVIRERYSSFDIIPLHVPVFEGKEKEYLLETIDSTFVSSIGEYVDQFEDKIAEIAGTAYAVATVNGTSALHMALLVSGVSENDEVLTQGMTFVATANAISYLNAEPVFLDIDKDTLGLSSKALNCFLEENAEIRSDGNCWNKKSDKRIKACVPMHTFGHPCEIEKIVSICDTWNISVIEDAAESLGSYYRKKHTGSFGKLGIFSFNGNKIVTCGGGGAIVTDDYNLAKKAKHLTTQAKKDHAWKYEHDAIGYNYRLPNLNAALACAQLEQLDKFVEDKRKTAEYYKGIFKNMSIPFQVEPKGAVSNYWLNVVYLDDETEQEAFLNYSNKKGVMTRPAWGLMSNQSFFSNKITGELRNAKSIASKLVNIPSSYRG